MALVLALNSVALKLPLNLDAPKLPAVALAAALSLSLNVHSALAGGELAADLASKVAGAVPTVDVAGAAAGLNDNINANIGKTDFQERLAKTKAGLGGLQEKLAQGDCSLVCLAIWFAIVLIMLYCDLQVSPEYQI